MPMNTNLIVVSGRVYRAPHIFSMSLKPKGSKEQVKVPFASFLLYNEFCYMSSRRKYKQLLTCVCFSQMASVIDRYVNKGDRVIVTGHVYCNLEWNNQRKQKENAVKILIKNIEFVDDSKNKTYDLMKESYFHKNPERIVYVAPEADDLGKNSPNEATIKKVASDRV